MSGNNSRRGVTRVLPGVKRRAAISKWRKQSDAPAVSPGRRPSAFRVCHGLMPCHDLRKENDASRFIGSMCQKALQLKRAQQGGPVACRMLKKNKSHLNQWFSDISQRDVVDLQRVAAGTEVDATAIRKAISSRWRNGVVGDHVNRLKMLKRQMQGRMHWNSRLLSEREGDGRSAVDLSAGVNGIYLSRANLDVAFDDSGRQISPQTAYLTGNVAGE